MPLLVLLYDGSVELKGGGGGGGGWIAVVVDIYHQRVSKVPLVKPRARGVPR